MKIFTIMIFIVFSLCLVAENLIPDFYYTPEDIEAELHQIANDFPAYCAVDSIGVIENPYDNLDGFPDYYPIWALKIAYNPTGNPAEDQDKPAALFTCVHAEEVLGVSAQMDLIRKILNNPFDSPYFSWLGNFELWFVPTANPFGLKAVHELDNSYRKNGRDANGDGIFDFQVGYGNDEDGVDLNRNWDYAWVHGDTLGHVGTSVETFDYYRGAAPMSEPELQVLKNLADREHFIYSIVWHSSRQGGLSEKVFYPWKWGRSEERRCPDFDICQEIGEGAGLNISTYDGNGTYEVLPSTKKVGTSTPWFYQHYGTIQLTIEVSDHQPTSVDVVNEICDNVNEGATWLLNRMGNGISDDSSAMLTGHVTDAITGDPLVAEVRVHENHSNELAPRLTDEVYGRYWRPLTQGEYTVSFIKEGYATQTIIEQTVYSSGHTLLDVQLQALAASNFSGTINLNGIPVDAEICINDNVKDPFLVVGGSYNFTLYAGENKVVITADGAFPYTQTIIIDEEGDVERDYHLAPSQVIISENFDSISDWTSDGAWEVQSELVSQGAGAVTDSWGDHGFYAPNQTVTLTYNNVVDLSQHPHVYLTFDHHLYTEWDYDTVHVEFKYVEDDTWISVFTDSGKKDYWHQEVVMLDEWTDGQVNMRLRLTDTSPAEVLVEPGWTIDNLQILGSNSTEVVNPHIDVSRVAQLKANYPNPFNPSTTISFEIPAGMLDKVASIAFFNIKGQQVENINLSNADKKSGLTVWDAHALPSGVYLYRLLVDGKVVATKKSLLMK